MVNLPRCGILLVLLCFISLSSCDEDYIYRQPERTEDGWRTGTLADADLDEKILTDLVVKIRRRKIPNVHSILIVKEGALVFEEYFSGYRFDYFDEELKGEAVDYDMNTLHNTMSVTKAVTAALVGIGIDRGLVAGVDEPVYSLFPRYSQMLDPGKEELTLKHLLTMTSGFRWNEWDVPLSEEENDLIQLFIVEDPIEYILSKDLIYPPGSHWYYSGGDVNLLGEAFKEATGRRIDDFSDEFLFKPMGITNYEWKYINPEIVYASGELDMRPRDMAKLGYLFLNDGRWGDESIISAEWVEASLQEHASILGRTEEGEGFGYQWFLKSYTVGSRTIQAMQRTGWGGQGIILFPSLDMLAVLTGGNYLTENPIFDIIQDFILPAGG